jgi:hypothetical protein
MDEDGWIQKKKMDEKITHPCKNDRCPLGY